MKSTSRHTAAAALLFLALLCGSTAGEHYTVSGQVYYGGAATGAHLVVFVTTQSNAWASSWSTNLEPSSTTYAISNIPSGTYWLRAYIDVDGDLMRQPREPAGVSGNSPIVITNDLADQDIAVYDAFADFEGWYPSGSYVYDPATTNRYRIYMSGGGFTASLPERSDGGGQCFRLDLLGWGYVYAYTRLGQHADSSSQAFGIVPRPGHRYRISFEAKGDRINRSLPLRWYNLSYISDNPKRNRNHFYSQDAVLLSTNWQTYSKVLYFDHDDSFVRFGNTASTNAFFQMMFEPLYGGTYWIDNVTLTELPETAAAPVALINPGFERGWYGWSDDAHWAHTGLGSPSSEPAEAHWQLTTNAPHSGRYCVHISLPPFEELPYTFQPRLLGGGVTLERGKDYVLSYWRRDKPNAMQLLTVGDTFSRAHALVTYREHETGWYKVTLPLYHYGEAFENTNYTWTATGEPIGDRPIHLRIDFRQSPWIREFWVDDFDLQVIDESTARSLVTDGPGDGLSPAPVAEYADPFFLTTAFSPVAPFHLLETDDNLQVPLTLMPPTNGGMPSSVDLLLEITDFRGQTSCSESVTFYPPPDGLTTNYTLTDFGDGNGLPEGLYSYTWSATNLLQTASDRFWVRGTNRWLRDLPVAAGFIGFDRWDLAYPLSLTGTVPRRVLGDYDLEHLQLFGDIGARFVRLWLNGWSVHEVGFIEDLADILVPNGYEIVLSIAGYSDPTSAWPLKTADFEERWDDEGWRSYISNMASRLQGKVRHYQVGNEMWDLSSTNYMRLLTNTAEIIRRVDSNAVVHAFNQILAEGTLKLIDDIYGLGADRWIDVADYHDYFRIAHQESYLDRLMRTVRKYEDGKVSYDQPGEYWLPPTNASIWQAEYFVGWSKITPGNRITEQERNSASVQMAKMLMAKAFGVERYILYDARPGFLNNGMFAAPMHAPHAGPAISLLYASTATLAEELTLRELKEIFSVNLAYVFGFGPIGSNATDRVAAWSTAQVNPVTIATNVPPFILRYMDGSSMATQDLILTASPVFLAPAGSSGYDWHSIFGTNSIAVR